MKKKKLNPLQTYRPKDAKELFAKIAKKGNYFIPHKVRTNNAFYEAYSELLEDGLIDFTLSKEGKDFYLTESGKNKAKAESLI